MQTIYEDAEKLLERNRVGALLRIFASTPDDVERQITSALGAAQRLLACRIGTRHICARIDFLVSSDTEFGDSDCGLTAARLRERVRTELPNTPISVFEIKKGDIYTMLLNYGIATQLEDRISYSFIISHWAQTYITSRNITALLSAVHNHARVAGLVLPEIADNVRQGRIANTFALWHNKSLMTVGGFDLRASKPMKQNELPTDFVAVAAEVDTANQAQNNLQYNRAGTEEIIPSLRLVKYFGKSIRIVEPEEFTPNPVEHFGTDWQKRHAAKLATRDLRQRYMASLVGIPIDSLTEALIE
jgi:hypothetical protein